VDGQGGPIRAVGDGGPPFVDQGHHRAGVSGIPDRQGKGEEAEARGGLGDQAGLAANLRGAVAFALVNRGNRGIVGIDDFTRGQELALGEPPGLGDELVVGGVGSGELGGQAPLLVFRQVRRPLPGCNFRLMFL
jgi:hypothetical protein